MRTLRPSDRRCEQRFCHRAGKPLSWRPEKGGRRHRAWLRNISLSGLSFVSQGSRHPREGQEIDVLYQDARSLGTYRIVRVTKTARRTAIIGCRRDIAVPSPLTSSPEPVVSHAGIERGSSRGAPLYAKPPAPRKSA